MFIRCNGILRYINNTVCQVFLPKQESLFLQKSVFAGKTNIQETIHGMTARKLKRSRGFTLIELIVTTVILGIIIVGLIQSFIVSALLADIATRKTVAASQAQDKLEEILNHTFDNIITDYASGGTPGNTFNLASINGKGLVTVTTYTTNVLQVDVVVAFQIRNGRVIGEDKDLDGVLDAGEDANSNGFLDSPVKISTYIRRG